MFLDSLVSRILRALAEYSLLSLWVARRRLAYEHKHPLFFGFWVCFCLFTNISKGTAFLLQGLTENDSKGKNVTI